MVIIKITDSLDFTGVLLKDSDTSPFIIGNKFISGICSWNDTIDKEFYDKLFNKPKYQGTLRLKNCLYGPVKTDTWGTFTGYYDNGKKNGRFTNNDGYMTFKNDVLHGPFNFDGAYGIMDCGRFIGVDNGFVYSDHDSLVMEKLMNKMVWKKPKKRRKNYF